MAGTALVIGGTGQIGQAVCRTLANDGWRVTAARRGDPAQAPAIDGVQTIAIDREQPGALGAAIGSGVDALIDTIAYDESHARQLLEVQADVGTFVVISSASVYQDGKGRSLDEAAVTGFPDLPVPIGEDQATVAPGPQTYSTRKVALEQALLHGAQRPVIILRPCAIHGRGSRHPREWFFVRRILDGRHVVPLAWKGESRFHTSATINIAALVAAALRAPATAVFNAADPEDISVAAIGAIIARQYRHDWRLVPIDGPPMPGVGQSPWSIPRPFVVDMARAEALGYRPVTTYQDAVGEACRSAEASARAGVVFPPYLAAMFDYAAEDAFLASKAAGTTGD